MATTAETRDVEAAATESIDWKAPFLTVKKDVVEFVEEIAKECNPLTAVSIAQEQVGGIDDLKNLIHIPYFPAFHQPGWLARYAIGPFDEDWVESLVNDFQAGLTVLMTLIPQVKYKTLQHLHIY